MKKENEWSIWGIVAKLILRYRIIILSFIVLLTAFFSTKWEKINFTFTEANLLPDNHPENIIYESFKSTFGEEGNLIVIAIQDTTFYTKNRREAWKELNEKIESFE